MLDNSINAGTVHKTAKALGLRAKKKSETLSPPYQGGWEISRHNFMQKVASVSVSSIQLVLLIHHTRSVSLLPPSLATEEFSMVGSCLASLIFSASSSPP